MPRCKPGGTQATPSSTLPSPPTATTDTTAEPGASALSPQEVRQLLNKADKGNKQALDALCTRVERTAWFWEWAGNMATQVQEALLTEYPGKEALLTHEAQKRRCAALRRDLAGAAPTPIETLLVDRIVLCWLHLHLVEALYAQNMQKLSIQQLDFHERRVSLAQRRYLSAIRTLAQVRRLQVPAVQVNIAGQQLNVAAISP